MSDRGQTSSSAICTVQGLHHHYGEHAALAGIDLTLDSGHVFALLGPNGSGKTTLFRILCTLLPIQQGQVRIGGFDCQHQPLEVRRQIGIVFQAPSLDLKLTIDENIACQGALYGIHGAALRDRRDAVLQQLDLVERRHQPCQMLSGGLKRRVELAWDENPKSPILSRMSRSSLCLAKGAMSGDMRKSNSVPPLIFQEGG